MAQLIRESGVTSPTLAAPRTSEASNVDVKPADRNGTLPRRYRVPRRSFEQRKERWKEKERIKKFHRKCDDKIGDTLVNLPTHYYGNTQSKVIMRQLQAWYERGPDKPKVEKKVHNMPYTNRHAGTRRKQAAWKEGMRKRRVKLSRVINVVLQHKARNADAYIRRVISDGTNLDILATRIENGLYQAEYNAFMRAMRKESHKPRTIAHNIVTRVASKHDGVECQTGLHGIVQPPKAGSDPPMLVGPVMDHAARRHLRDLMQCQAAKDKLLRDYRSLPKRLREMEVKSQRDKRNPSKVEAQGGLGNMLAGAAVTAAAVPVLRALKVAIDKFGRAVESVAIGVNNVTKAATTGAADLVSHFRHAVEVIKKTAIGSLWAIPIVVGAYVLTRDMPRCVILAVAGALLAIFGKPMYEKIAHIFVDDGEKGVIQSQSGIMDNLSKITSTIAIFSIFKGKFRGDRVSELLKRIALLPRLKEGVEEMARWAVAALETTINWVRSFFGKEKIVLMEKTHALYKEWQKDVDNDCKHLGTCKTITPEFVRGCIDHLVIGYGLKQQYHGHPMMRQVQEHILRLQHAITPYKGVMHSSNNFRFEPSLVMLHGKPGIGKTLLMQHFCLAAMFKSGLLPAGTSAADASAHIWQKGTSDYWNGYTNQTCIVMDDAFQQRVDSTDKENEYINIIRMIGTWAYPLNFADLESKGNIYFNSKLVMGTTNLRCLSAEAALALNEPAAVIRRITHGYTLILTDEFSKGGQLDYNKYHAECDNCKDRVGIDTFPWHIWNVQRIDFSNGHPTGPVMPLRTALLDLVEDLKGKLTSHAAARDNLAGFVASINAEMAGPRVESGLKANPACDEILPYPEADYHIDAAKVQRMNCVRRKFKEETEARRVREEQDAAYEQYQQEIRRMKQEHKIAWRVGQALGWATVGLFAYGVVKLIVNVLVGVFTTLMGLLGLPSKVVKAVRNKCKKKDEDEIEAQSNAPRLKPKWYKKGSPQVQSGSKDISLNAYDNSYKMTLEGSYDCQILGQTIFLEDTLAVEPYHYYRDLELGVKLGTIARTDIIKFTHSSQQSFVFSVTVGRYLNYPRKAVTDMDISFVVHENVRAHRQIITNFITEQDVKHIQGRNVRLDVFNSVNSRAKYGEHMIHCVARPSVGCELTFEARFGKVEVKRHIKYTALTSMGDCGAPLSLMDANCFSGRGIIGMHVAGQPCEKIGYSTIITQELIREAKSELKVISDKLMEDLGSRVRVESGCTLPFTNPGSFLPICRVDVPVRLNPKSCLTAIPGVFGMFGETDELPAPLSKVFRDGQVVYPMEQALSGYATELLTYEQPWLDQAVYLAFVPLNQRTVDDSRKLYTFEQAIKGAPQDKLRSIPRGTSAGYPYVNDVKNGKKEFFGYDDEVTIDSVMAVQLQERVTHVLEEAAEGNRLAHIFMDCLKDELRSEKKVLAVETRLLSASPLDYLVCFRMMFGSFITACMRNHTDIGMAPGINPYTNWGGLRDFLRQKSNKVFDGDFKAFDKSEMPDILGKFVHHINKWYAARPQDGGSGERNNRIREVLWLELIHSRHIGGQGYDQSYIYQWNKSLPSGHPCTTIANSLYALVAMIMAYISATKDLTGFWDNVACVTYGDDNITAPKDSVVEVFNQITVAKHLKEQLGMTYTPGNKNDVWVETTNIENATFLKRGFVEENGRWLAPLALDSIRSMAYWNKGLKHVDRDLKSKLESMLQELSLHPREVWDEFAPKIETLMAERGYTPQAEIKRESYRLIITSDEDFWF